MKESVFPFLKFAGVDIVLGPGDALDRRSDGHQRAVLDRVRQEPARRRHGAAAARATSSSAWPSGTSRRSVDLARKLAATLGFSLLATDGTADALEAAGMPVKRVKKIAEGPPNLLDYFAERSVALVINTPSGKRARTDEGNIRAAAVQAGVPCITTIEAATAAVKAMEALREEEMQVQALQDRFAT